MQIPVKLSTRHIRYRKVKCLEREFVLKCVYIYNGYNDKWFSVYVCLYVYVCMTCNNN